MDTILHILRSLAGALIRQWPDLVGTFYGVLLGGLATLGIVRWQLNEERKGRERHEREFLTLLVEHVNREIAKNLRTFRDLMRAFEQASVPPSPARRTTIAFDVAHRVRQARAKHVFNEAYRDNAPRLNEELLQEVRSLLPKWLASLERADRKVATERLPWTRPPAPRHKRARRRLFRRKLGSIVRRR